MTASTKSGPTRTRAALTWVAVLVLCLVPTVPAAAHGDLHERIAALTKRIELNPTQATLYLQRGDLHRHHRDWTAALADYDRAARLDATLVEVDLARGTALAQAGQPQHAITALDRFLARQADHAPARVERARALVQLGRHREAAEDLTRAIAQLSAPRPEHYLERARALIAQKPPRLDEARRGIDEGIRKLGPLISLQLYAIDLEVEQKRYDAALERLTLVAAQSPRKERWFARRGEILERAGLANEARAAYLEALASLESLPPRHRQTKATRALEAHTRAALDRFTRPPPVPASHVRPEVEHNE